MLRLAIQRPIAVSMIFLALVLIGSISFQKLPVDLLPSITYPRLTIITEYEDIPAEDLERLITEPIEEVVTALSGARRVLSRTREGVSIITVEYEWGTQMEFAHLHLREAVDRVAFRDDFPEAADRPIILRWDPLSRPISILTLSGSSRMKALTEFATEVVKPALQQVEGLSQAEVVGGEDREIVVQPDPAKMAIYGITIDNISQALSRSNISFPGGKIKKGPLHLSLRISGEFESLSEIEDTDIIRSGRTPIRISDVADVLDTAKEQEGATLLGSEPVVSLLLYKEPEANTIQVSKGIDKSLEILQKDYTDFKYDFVYRDAAYVRSSFMGLVQSLIFGAILAFLVLFFFLKDFRSPIVVGISIPVSIMITFAFLYFGKVKLNLMSLGGLSLAAGMLVDNAIVVLENINRHLDKSFSPNDSPKNEGINHRRIKAAAAQRGASEVARPVFAATLTTVAVFFPVVYVPGIAGAFFRDQALAVTFSLLVSIAAALLLQPMLSARVLKYNQGPPANIFGFFDRVFLSFYNFYHRRLVSALRRPGLMISVMLVLLLLAAFLGYNIERSFMPERSSGDFAIDIELPNGTPLEETTDRIAGIADWLGNDPNVSHVFSKIGHTERTIASLKEYSGPNSAHLRVIMKPSRSAHSRSMDMRKRISKKLSEIPGTSFGFRDEGIGLEEILGTESGAFSIGIISENAMEGLNAAERLVASLSIIDGFDNIHIDRVMGTPNLVVRLNNAEIMRKGLSPDNVARELRNRIKGIEATTYNEVDQRIDIAVRIDRSESRNIEAALNSTLKSGNANPVKLGSLVDLSEEVPVRELNRRNQRPMVTITSSLQGASSDEAWEKIKAAAAKLDFPPGVTLVQGSEREEMLRSMRDLSWAMLLAVLLVYVILAAQFESFIDPLLIASIIPIGIAGAMITLGISGQTINLLSIIGMIALLGISVNDAIIKIDAIKRLMAEGMEGYKAVLEASRLRFRPILMTSVTTILAMLPMAIGLGTGEQIQRPLALTIIGGLFFTTALTLIYTPLLFMLVHRIRRID